MALTREEAIQEIRERTPGLLADYRALAKELCAMLGIPEAGNAEEDDRPEMETEELYELYEAILEFAEGYDLDSIDLLLSQAKDYRVPESERARFAKVENCVRESDWDTLKEELSDL